MAKYDIFISYRREGGYDTAKHLYDLLNRDGYNVSFDIDTLRSGDFDIQLLDRINQCKDFILIVDQNCFDRTLNPNFNPKHDWLRQELSYALKKRKNIIPIFLNGVSGFPNNLPRDISEVSKKNGPEYNRYYFNDFYQRLKDKFLHTKSSKKRKWLVLGVIFSIAACLILLYTPPLWKEEINKGNNNDFLTDYSLLKIGDYVYSDGTFTHDFRTDKEAVGIVFSLTPTALEINKGWSHGLMMALYDCGPDKYNGGYYNWEDLEWWDSLETVVDSVETALNLKDKQGYYYTSTKYTDSDKYPAFAAARENLPRYPFMSGWYVPTVGQWVEILQNLGGVVVNISDTGIVYDSKALYRNMRQYNMSNTSVYWTASDLFDQPYSYCIEVGSPSQVTSVVAKSMCCKVRPIASF